jgi:CelD/BcsL family acetyltransferase involved in cellulose biosynthesis
MKPNLDVAVLKDSQAFRALEAEWEDLYRECALSTPFQSWAWLYSWWEAFGEGYELRLITVRDGTFLVGLIPLMLERRWGLRRLRSIGFELDRMDLLARNGWEDKVSEAAVGALNQLVGSWHVLDLQALSPAATAWRVFQLWNGPRGCLPAACYLFIEVKPSDELLASLSRNHRHSVRRALRRAYEDGVCSVLVGAGEVEQAARRLVMLHRKLRQGRRMAREHLTPMFDTFVVGAARRMTDRGLGRIYELRQGSGVLISSLTLFGDEVTHACLVGVSEEARIRYQWSSLGIWDAIEMARARCNTYLCLSSGQEPYKQRWAPEEVAYYRVILGRGRVLWGLYWACVWLRKRGPAYIKARRSAKLIKNTAQSLRRRARGGANPKEPTLDGHSGGSPVRSSFLGHQHAA